MPARAPIEIAIAVVEREGCFLIGPRDASLPLGGLWEFPGGKIESGETPAAAAVRECLEETGIAVEVLRELLVHEETYEHAKVRLHFLAARPAVNSSTEPRPPFRWVPRAELGRYEFPSGNRDLLKLLAERL